MKKWIVDGEAVQRVRKDRGFTQRSLAIRISVTETTISRIETGTTKNPRSSVMAAIWDALEVKDWKELAKEI